MRAVLQPLLISLFIPWFRLEAWEFALPWVGEVAIQPFGLLVAIGILVAARIAEQRAEASGVSADAVIDLILHILPLAFVAAYFLNAAFYQPRLFVEVVKNPMLLSEKALGLSSFGGFVGGITGALLWRYRRRMSLLRAGDAVAYAFPVGWLFGRTGCFVVHDHPGVVTDFPLAVANYRMQGVARHDLGLYEALFSLAVVVLFWALGRRQRKTGFFLAWLPLLYAPVRFFLDFLRATPEAGGDARYLGLTPGQYGSLVMLAIGLALLLRVVRGAQPADDRGETGDDDGVAGNNGEIDGDDGVPAE